jgi:hypothetical protein
MADGDIEVYHQDEQWHVRSQGTSAPLSDHDTKDEAKQEGRKPANGQFCRTL